MNFNLHSVTADLHNNTYSYFNHHINDSSHGGKLTPISLTRVPRHLISGIIVLDVTSGIDGDVYEVNSIYENIYGRLYSSALILILQ